MSFAKVYSAQPTLLSAKIIAIETDLARGLHAFTIVGLPDKAVEESRDRVSAAIKNSGYTSPKSKNQKVVISLAPADLKKEGPSFDLGIALSYLLAAKEISFDPEKKLFLGELSLDGTVQTVNGVLSSVRQAAHLGFTDIFVPLENRYEAALAENVSVFGVKNLSDVIAHLDTANDHYISPAPKVTLVNVENTHTHITLDDIRGQETAKRGLEIAAAGGHNIALYGPPGTGKTMLAKAFHSLLPPLSFEDSLDVTAIHSVAGLTHALITTPPFRAPHHTASYVSLVGGGTYPKPGEITLAHKGILFLDEFPEFDRRVIESLRQPLEEHEIIVSRARGSTTFPAHFILIAAMNPCVCGNYGSSEECTCSPQSLMRYQRKISGPIVDRIDMWINVPNIAHKKLTEKSTNAALAIAQKRIRRARSIQKDRFKKYPRIHTNAEMSVKELDKLLALKAEVQQIFIESAAKLKLSPRAYHRTIKLARTIADLCDHDSIEVSDALEALQYRPKKLSYI